MSECEHELEYYCTLDQLLPYGNIVSMAVFKCKKCGEEYPKFLGNTEKYFGSKVDSEEMK